MRVLVGWGLAGMGVTVLHFLVLFGFFLRLGLTVVLLYVSLKVLNGSVYALAAGLALGVFALTVEGLRLMKAWTV